MNRIEAAANLLFDAHVDYSRACAALDEAQAFYDRTANYMEDGPRATALAALATARFAKASAGALLLQTTRAALHS